MESISMGVPLATWPMHLGQPRNAFFITEFLKIGLVVLDWAHRDKLVTSIVVEDVITRLMDSSEGKNMQKRATDLGRTETDIQEKDKDRSQINKTEHEIGKSVKEKSSQSQKSTKSQSQIKSKSTPGSGFGKSIENQTRKRKLPKVGPPVPT
ncbi:hypothetical protein Tco_0587508 [Tanacetum coccineum]